MVLKDVLNVLTARSVWHTNDLYQEGNQKDYLKEEVYLASMWVSDD